MSNLTRQDALRLVREQGLNVNIPYGYRHIERAFFGLGIKSVTIPETVVHIWDEAFYGNELVSLTIPASVSTIGRHAFFNNNLSNVTFEGTPSYIRDYAFADNQIRQITLPNHIYDDPTFNRDLVFWRNPEDIKIYKQDDPPVAPSEITFSVNVFQPSFDDGSIVGSFSSTDSNLYESHTYSLVSGEGDDDNDNFSISGGSLRINKFDGYQDQRINSIRVQSKDKDGLTFSKKITFKANDSSLLEAVETDGNVKLYKDINGHLIVQDSSGNYFSPKAKPYWYYPLSDYEREHKVTPGDLTPFDWTSTTKFLAAERIDGVNTILSQTYGFPHEGPTDEYPYPYKNRVLVFFRTKTFDDDWKENSRFSWGQNMFDEYSPSTLKQAELDFGIDLSNDGEAVLEISGTTEVGQQLRITENTADPDGGTGTLSSYVWQSSSDNSTWTQLGTNSTYTVTSAEEGKKIRAAITYTDGQNFFESITSSVIEIKTDDGDAEFSIDGTAEVGETLSIIEDTADADGTGTLSYSWQTSSDDSTWSEVGTDSTYEVAASDEGKSIKAVISYEDVQGFEEEVTTSSSIIPYIDDGVAEFSIDGTAEVGETLSIIEDTSDADGTGTLSYSWQTSSDDSTWSEVGTDSTYEVAANDEGKSIKVVISYEDDQGFDEIVSTTSASIPYVDNGDASFSISGTKEVSHILRISEDYADPDGTGSLSYQWQLSSDNNVWTDLSKDNKYHVKYKNSNNFIRAIITYEDNEGFNESIATESIQIEKHHIESSLENLKKDLKDNSYFSDFDFRKYQHRFGSNNAETIFSTSDSIHNEIIWGLAENDTIYLNDREGGIKLIFGGSGNDNYQLGGYQNTFIVYEAKNHGSNDSINLSSNFLRGQSYVATIEKKHLIAIRGYEETECVIIIDALNESIETFNFGGIEYSSNFFLNNLNSFSSYEGNVDWNKIKALIGDRLTNDIKSAIPEIKEAVEKVENSKTDREFELNAEISSLEIRANDLNELVKSSSSITLDNEYKKVILTGVRNINAIGNSLDNILTGNAGENTIFGYSGNDIINGGLGNDVMSGGVGNDTYIVNSTSDLVTENSAEGTDLIQSSVTYTASDNVENLTLTGSSDIDATGNSLDNILRGNDGANSIKGNSGADTLRGGSGSDKLYGESGEDTLYGDSGNDYLSGGSYKDKLYGGTGKDTLRGGTNSDKLYGESGEDTLYGDSGNDYLSGGSYKDKLYGGSGKDTLRGGTNSDKLYGGSSADKLYGDSGNDYLNGGSSADKLYGGSGKDKLVGGTSNDRLYGGSSSDKLYGQSGKDYLRGDSGNDKLYGGSSNDTLIGGTGKDDVYGGSGRDIFKLTKGSGYDRIRDFKKRSDKIYVKGFKSLRIKDVGRHTKIYNGRKDLLAIVYNEDNLRKSGSYLI